MRDDVFVPVQWRYALPALMIILAALACLALLPMVLI